MEYNEDSGELDFREAYITNPEGESRTASFLRDFLPSAYTLIGDLPSSLETLQTVYKKSSPNYLKSYIGRAASTHSTTANHLEESLCILADVEQAAAYISEEEQSLLALLCEGIETDQIADIYEVHPKQAERYIKNVIQNIANILDGTC